MTEIGEPIAIGMVDSEEIACPFDHSLDPPSAKNDLIGSGTTLNKNMKNAVETYLIDKYKEKPQKLKNPREDDKHAFYKRTRCVIIIDSDAAGREYQHTYPVTCAAHHCVPAQESLKESPLLTFMVKKGEPEPLKDGSYSGGSVWCDVGYDVNGTQNGIYLPGSYAVGGGRGGLGLWASNDDGDDDEAEPEDKVPDPASAELTGVPGQVSLSNRQWLYVAQAVEKCPGQFHDRHVDYSKFVQEVLQKIFANYKKMYRESVKESKCGDCSKKADKIKELGIPTPFGLVTRLNKVSDKFKSHLNAAGWVMNVFTSRWGLAYMKAVVAKDPAARPGSPARFKR